MTQSSKRLTRRGFAAALGASGVAAPALLAQQQPQGAPNPNPPVQPEPPRRRGPRPEVPPFQAPLEFARKDVPDKVRPFPMTQVRLLPGVCKNAESWNLGYMSRLPADKLLHNFRRNAGLPSSVSHPFGGWEAPADGRQGTELRGHFTGHFLSASALMYAATGDKDVKAKGDLLVDELAKVQQKLGGGYLSAFPTELFDRLDSLSGKPPDLDPATGRPRPGAAWMPWAPFYTIHKIMAGFLDMYQLAGNKQALQVLEGMAAWADRWSASKTEEHMQAILEDEFGGMAEVLYNLSAATGNGQWARAGDRFTKTWFANMLGFRRDELNKGPGGWPLHVNTHIPQVIGFARRFEISGDMRFHDAADFFWDAVTTGHTYVTTGTSNNESWQMPARRLAAEMNLGAGPECCCSYNMLKLARHLYGWTADPRYFDYYERSLLNHRLGTVLPEKGYTQYYLGLRSGSWKTFNDEEGSFWCCTGTGVEEYSKLNDSIYWHDGQGLYVNLFVPSELNWEERGFKLRQDTRFPDEAGTTLLVTAAGAAPVPLRLRIPSWLGSAPAVKINGKALTASASPGSYLAIDRVWKSGDRIEMELPMRLAIEATPDDPGMQAVLYGPVVLAGDLGSEGLREDLIVSRDNAPDFQRVPRLDIPAFHAPGPDPASWIQPGGKPLTFRTTGQLKDVALVPLNSLFDRRYMVYLKVS